MQDQSVLDRITSCVLNKNFNGGMRLQSQVGGLPNPGGAPGEKAVAGEESRAGHPQY